MKMTKIEKGILTVIIAIVMVLVMSITYTVIVVKQNGGVKQVIIESAKEIKSIAKEIKKD